MKTNVYIYILVMAGVTYLIRMLPLALAKKEITNPFIRSFLYYVRLSGCHDISGYPVRDCQRDFCCRWLWGGTDCRLPGKEPSHGGSSGLYSCVYRGADHGNDTGMMQKKEG